MELQIIENNNIKIAKLIPDSAKINATDFIGNADYQGARNIILHEHDLDPKFFDLKTGIAGEILQKCANYRMKLAIIGEFEKYNSNALNAFIIECNRGSSIFFVADEERAAEKFA